MLSSSIAIEYKIVPQQYNPQSSTWEDVPNISFGDKHHLDWQDELLQGRFEDTFHISQVKARKFLEEVLVELPRSEQSIILAKLNRGAPTLELRINLECNNSCTHCFITHREGYTPSFEELKQHVDSTEAGTHVTLTGGEPTLHPHIVPLVRYIKKSGRDVSIQTNGRAFKDMEFVNAIALYTHSVQIPIHSIRETVFDEVTQATSSFRETVRGLANLHGKIRTTTQTVITKYNYRELEHIAEFIYDVLDGNATMVLTYPYYMGAAVDNLQSVAVTYEQIHPYLQSLLKKYSSKMKIHTHYIPSCYLYPYNENITCVDIGASVHSHTGFDMRERQLIYGDTNQNIGDKYIKVEECRQCSLFDICPGTLREYIELAGFDFHPVPIPQGELH